MSKIKDKNEYLLEGGVKSRIAIARNHYKTQISYQITRLGFKQSHIVEQMNNIFERDLLIDPKTSKPRIVYAWEFSRWALGKNTPDLQAVKVMAEIFNIDISDLVAPHTVDNENRKMTMVFDEIEGIGFNWRLEGVVNADVHRRLLQALAS